VAAKLKISIAQMKVAVARPGKNLEKAEAFVAKAKKKGSDIICFPEMWTTGFDWAANKGLVCETDEIVGNIADMARRFGIWINGSILAPDAKGKASNASMMFNPDGDIAGTYRKIHLFGAIREDRNVAPGNSLSVVDTPWARAGLAICYDIRFPELFRAYAMKGARMIFLPAAFPRAKLAHWKTLIRARAIEDQLFMIAANQVGVEDFGIDGRIAYCGNSAIIGPWGETVAEASAAKEELITAAIDIGKVDEIRNKMKVFRDRRPDVYKL